MSLGRGSHVEAPRRTPPGRLPARGRARRAVLGALLLLAFPGGAPAAGESALSRLELEPVDARSAPAAVELGSAWLARGEWSGAADLLQWGLEIAVERRQRETERQARALLGSVDRFMVRPTAGVPLWGDARQVDPPRPDLERPAAVAARGDAQLLAVWDEPASVTLLDGAGALLGVWNRSASGRPAIGPGGGLYVTGGEGVAELSSGSERGAAPLPAERDLAAAVRNAAGDWVVVERRSKVAYLAPRGAARRLLPGIEAAIDAAAHPAGGWLVLDRGRQAVVRYTAAGETVATIDLEPLRKPLALDADPSGNVYVLDGSGRILVLDRAGERLQLLGPRLPGGVELRRPGDVAVDDTGRIFVADRRTGLVVLE